ncbi:hypothetical protein [Micromonospora sp. URMC 103]|uniref:hypothetical protein n=1 Tax=Micromonospora sp. URMC 103 TaxID=3423406 RepID=UPI003F1C0C5C
MGLTDATPVGWILPALLVVAWLSLWAVRRRVPLWFPVLALCLAILCFPIGAMAGSAEVDDPGCTPDIRCFSITAVDWWLNGLLGMLTCAALAVLTVAAELGRAAVRYLSRRSASR